MGIDQLQPILAEIRCLLRELRCRTSCHLNTLLHCLWYLQNLLVCDILWCTSILILRKPWCRKLSQFHPAPLFRGGAQGQPQQPGQRLSLPMAQITRFAVSRTLIRFNMHPWPWNARCYNCHVSEMQTIYDAIIVSKQQPFCSRSSTMVTTVCRCFGSQHRFPAKALMALKSGAFAQSMPQLEALTAAKQSAGCIKTPAKHLTVLQTLKQAKSKFAKGGRLSWGFHQPTQGSVPDVRRDKANQRATHFWIDLNKLTNQATWQFGFNSFYHHGQRFWGSMVDISRGAQLKESNLGQERWKFSNTPLTLVVNDASETVVAAVKRTTYCIHYIYLYYLYIPKNLRMSTTLTACSTCSIRHGFQVQGRTNSLSCSLLEATQAQPDLASQH